MKARLLLIRNYITISVFVLVSLQAKPQINKPHLQVPLLKSAPVIDGKLSDPLWQQASELSEFVNWSLDTYIKDPVSVFICYDEKNLYVAFRNSDPKAVELNKTVSPKGPRDTFSLGKKSCHGRHWSQWYLFTVDGRPEGDHD
jgi:hypothetical protein